MLFTFKSVAGSVRKARKVGLVCSAALALPLAGCSTLVISRTNSQVIGDGEAPTVMGPSVRDNATPMEGVLSCFGQQMIAKGGPRLTIAVGDVKDYTGKYSVNEGNAITQGGALMVYSALGKIGGGIGVAERFDPIIAERELGYADRRQLGDGRSYEVNGNKVPWLPYYGGSITKSDYYIVGGITELNYNVASGGAQIAVDGIGPKGRIFSESVGIDLRIVDSRSLVVIKTISLSKQFVGYEVGAGVFRFFGTNLFDINLGAKAQEPLQLGIRTALEEATVRLVASVANLDTSACLAHYDGRVPTVAQKAKAVASGAAAPAPAEAAPVVGPGAAPTQSPAAPAPVGQSLNALPAGGGAPTGKLVQIGFEFADVALGASAQGVLDQIAQAVASGPLDVMVVARDTENWDPAKRDALLDQRLAAIIAALGNRGIPPASVSVTWRPDRADTSIHRDGPGNQQIAMIRILK